MSAIQIAFLGGLLLVLASVTAFSAAVFRNGINGGRAAGLGLFRRRVDHSRLGRLAFLAHRLTGVAIFVFLGLHILDVGLYSVSHRLYDEVQPLYGSAPLRVLECGLLFAVLFHTTNGLRLLAIDLVSLSPTRARRLLGLVIAASVIVGTGGSAIILAPLFR